MRRNKKKKTQNRGFLLFTLVSFLVVLAGCTQKTSRSNQKTQDTDFAMGTVISQNIYGENGKETAGEVLELIQNLEKIISWRIEDSSVAKINRCAGSEEKTEVEEDLSVWLTKCQDVYRQSEGAFDITVGPAARLWDIGGENPRVPSEQEIKQTLAKIDGSKLTVEQNEVSFVTKDGQLDLGAVGKGIACDEIARYLKEEENNIHPGTYSVGGSVLVFGEKPDQSEWKIGIQDPRGEEGTYMGVVSISQKEGETCFLSTSGDYEKYIEQDGVRYHHIMDPRTGAPADSGLISVTILSDSGFLSDALSTACFVAGREKGLELAAHYGAEAILIDKEKNIYTTEKIKEQLTVLEKEYRFNETK